MPDKLTDALLELAKLEKSDLHEMVRAITNASAVALNVERVSIWWNEEDCLRCEDLFLLSTSTHESGMRLSLRDFPRYISAVQEGRALPVYDAQRDPTTASLRASYLEPLRIASMLDVPIWRDQELVGVLCHEQVGERREWTALEIAFAGNLADLVCKSLEARDRRRAETWVRGILKSVQEAVFVIDDQRGIQAINEAGKELLEQALGETSPTQEEWRSAVDYRSVDEVTIPHEVGPLARAFRGELIRDEIVGIHFKRLGETSYYRADVVPVWESGRVEYVIATAMEMSEEVRFERLKRDFLLVMAHELKTPLTVIRGYAEHLMNSPELPRGWRTHLKAVCRRTEQMDSIIGNLLDLATIQLGRLLFNAQRLDFASLVDEVVTNAREAHPQHPISLSRPTELWVNGDRTRLGQVVRELITNALRYSPRDTPITVALEAGDSEAVLRVEDRGIGIPAPLLHRVFEPFFRAHAGTEFDRGGLGLGLFLAREIVQKHGGSMWLESEEHRGTIAFLRLPIASTPS
jgi:signal transduction histidine kinase